MSDDSAQQPAPQQNPEGEPVQETLPNANRRMPTAVFVIGLAGTGKTTLTQRINHFVLGSDGDDEQSGGAAVGQDGEEDEDEDGTRALTTALERTVLSAGAGTDGAAAGAAGASSSDAQQQQQQQQPSRKQNTRRSYFVNFDPAVLDVPFSASIDIRDTITQREVMTKMRLGPNGAIMTALNIFATRIHEVLALIENRADELDYVFIDTPGQIEVFTWSASGQMITEAFASTMPTCMLFVADTVRCANPQTFMSTMLYSCSVMYKSQLPLCVVFNKCDVTDGSRVTRWIEDSEELSAALRDQRTFASTLSDSLALFLGEFYANISHVSVSAMEGMGMPQLFRAIDAARAKFETEYAPLLAQRQQQQHAAREERARVDAQLLAQDVAAEAGGGAASGGGAVAGDGAVAGSSDE